MPPNPPTKRVAMQYPHFSKNILNPPPPKWNPRYVTEYSLPIVRPNIKQSVELAKRNHMLIEMCKLERHINSANIALTQMAITDC